MLDERRALGATLLSGKRMAALSHSYGSKLEQQWQQKVTHNFFPKRLQEIDLGCCLSDA